MTWLFGDKKKPQKTFTKRPLSEEEKKKKDDYKLSKEERRLVHKEYVQGLQNDPELMRQAMANIYKLNIKAIDPAEKKRRQFQDKVAERLLGMLESDEGFAADVLEAEKNKLIEEYASGKDYDLGDGRYGSGAGDLEEQLDMMERLKERFGGGGTLGNVVEMVKAVAPMLPLLMPKLMEMQQAQEAQQMRQTQHPAQLNTAPPVPAPPETVTEPVRPPPEQPPEALPETPLALDLEMCIPYLDGEPENFVAELNRLASEGDERALLVLEVLRTKDSYEILEMLQPLKEQEEYREIITRLEDQEWWLAGVIELVRAEELPSVDLGEE